MKATKNVHRAHEALERGTSPRERRRRAKGEAAHQVGETA